MTDSLIFSLSAVLPVFVLVLIGGIIRKTGYLREDFFSQANRFVFHITLPVTLFLDVVEGGALAFSGKLTAFCVLFLLCEILLLLLLVPILIKDNAKRGAFIQGAYRSNIAILGVPLIASIFGDSGSAVMATVMPLVVVLYNILAVVILTVFAPANQKPTEKELALRIGKSVLLNPLILGILAGLIFTLLPFSLPAPAIKTLSYIDGLTMPLSLFCLGASFRVASFKGRISLACIATLLRTVIFPTLALICAVLLGFRGDALGVIFVIFGSSTAIASFVMSKQMGSDSELSGQIVLFSTLFSALTIFLGTALLKYFALI